MNDEGARPIRHGRRWLLLVLPSLLVIVIGGWLGYRWLNPPAPPVELSDPRLETLIRTATRRAGPWTTEDLVALTRIGEPITRGDPFPRGGVRVDLSDITYCRGLQELHANDYTAEDLAPLGDLTELRVLDIAAPGAADGGDCDLTPLSHLTQLRTLKLTLGNTDDLSALSDLTELRELSLRSPWLANRFDLGPLAGLTKLRTLHLDLPNVSDLTPLRNMTDLRELSVWKVGASARTPLLDDISPLAGLTQLEELQLGGNRIEDIQALSGLDNLRVLFLEGNEISDITPLAGLTRLQWLSVGENRVSDISAVAGLKDLRVLDLDGNDISDISPLAALPGLGDTAPLNLRRQHFNRRQVRPRPGGSVSHSHGIRGMLHLSGNRISDISALVENPAVRARPDIASPEGAGDSVILLGNPLADEAYDAHIPALESRGVRVVANPRPSGGVISFADARLEQAVRDALVLPERPIRESDQLDSLTRLRLIGAGVKDLAGIERCSNLEDLDLQYNEISDISLLSHLIELKKAWLMHNPLDDEAYAVHIPALQERGVDVRFDPRP